MLPFQNPNSAFRQSKKSTFPRNALRARSLLYRQSKSISLQLINSVLHLRFDCVTQYYICHHFKSITLVFTRYFYPKISEKILVEYRFIVFQYLISATLRLMFKSTPKVFYKKRCSKTFHKIHTKTPVSEPLF